MKTRFAALAGAAVLALAAGAAMADDGIRREGTGERRTNLDALELKAFPDKGWDALTQWVGEKPTADQLKGKVVLFTTWSSWYRTSHSALSVSQDLANRFGKDGLVVIGVHHARGFDAADKVAGASNATFPYAHDADGKFRELLMVDQDPDFYLIDRAGNLRYADVATADVEKAVRTLVNETADDAAALPGRLATEAAAAERDAWRTGDTIGGLKPGQTLNVPFVMPDASVYEKAEWPEKNTGSVQSQNDVQGKALPASLGSETYITKRPVTDGRVVVLDFWAVWCGPCKAALPKLDDLQRANKDDLVLIGMSGQGEKVDVVKNYLASHKPGFAKAHDDSQTVYKAIGVQGIPLCVVMSTDGVVRWQGNPHSPDFAKAVAQVIKADPGVKARKKAEEEYLRRLQQGG